jgi:NADP-dependent alcohol dehydrogenase
VQNFQFSNPTKIIFGKGEIQQLPKEIPSNSKVLVLYGGGSVKKTGLLDAIKVPARRIRRY